MDGKGGFGGFGKFFKDDTILWFIILFLLLFWNFGGYDYGL
ncbi:hypothetical protein V6C42_12475 [Pseudoclostridium thermosuccinogenes]|jgi:hypothetical protein|nr:hypothetical protein [Pseudoclostridium thermosuccinogenes]